MEKIVSCCTYGSLEKMLLLTNLSLRDISEEFKRQGVSVSKDLVGRLLDELGYSKQVDQKHIQMGAEHPGRDEMFQRINQAIEDFCSEGCTVLSTDTMKEELVGNFKNEGAVYGKEKDGRRVLDHDFSIPELGKVFLYGIYVANNNNAFLNLGTDYDTGEFVWRTYADCGSTWGRKASERRRKSWRYVTVAEVMGGDQDCRNTNWYYWQQKGKYTSIICLQTHQNGTR